MIYFLLRRVAFSEEFAGHPQIIALELLIDDYTRRLLEILISANLLHCTQIYPIFYDPLFIISTVGVFDSSIKSQENVSKVIDAVRKIIASLLGAGVGMFLLLYAARWMTLLADRSARFPWR